MNYKSVKLVDTKLINNYYEEKTIIRTYDEDDNLIDKDGGLQTGLEMDSKTVYGGTANRNPAIFEKHIEDWMRQKVSQRQY